MCNHYRPPHQTATCTHWQVAGGAAGEWLTDVHPRQSRSFVRLDGEGKRELVCGQWALIPNFATAAVSRYSTNNTRSEELNEKAIFKGALETWSALHHPGPVP